jgi:hypothetical protein
MQLTDFGTNVNIYDCVYLLLIFSQLKYILKHSVWGREVDWSGEVWAQ